MIEISGLGKRYGDKVALADLSLGVGAGEVMGFLGPNGSGKTTTIRLLMGLLRPSGGRRRVLGQDCFADAVALKRQVGYLPEEPFLYPYLTAQELLTLVARAAWLPRRRVAAPGRGGAGTLRPGRRSANFTVTFSHGMKKRLALAAATLHDPRVLILDEPTNGLDPRGARDMRAIVTSLAAEGRTIFLVDASARERRTAVSPGGDHHRGPPARHRHAGRAARAPQRHARWLARGSVPGGDRGVTAPRPGWSGPLRLARLLVGLRYRSWRGMLKAGPRVGAARFAAVFAFVVPAAYVGLLSTALAQMGAAGHGDPAAQQAALALVAAVITACNLLSKVAGADLVVGRGGEIELLLARPVSLARLVVARGLAGVLTDVFGALFLLPVLVAAALVWRSARGGPAAGAGDLGAGSDRRRRRWPRPVRSRLCFCCRRRVGGAPSCWRRCWPPSAWLGCG